MTTITYYRYIPTLHTVKLKKDHQVHNVFTISYDHSECVQKTLEQVGDIIHKWLQDHYGFCIIALENNTHRMICNRKKMIKDLHKLNIEITIKEHI